MGVCVGVCVGVLSVMEGERKCYENKEDVSLML